MTKPKETCWEVLPKILGFIVLEKGFQVDPRKVKAIAKMALPFYKLLRKDIDFIWNEIIDWVLSPIYSLNLKK